MRLRWMGGLALLGLVGGTARADEEVMIGKGRSGCSRTFERTSWKLNGEQKLGDVLEALAPVMCERFFIPRALLGKKVKLDISAEEVSGYELRERVAGALRAQGYVLDHDSASTLRPASELDRMTGGYTPLPRPTPKVPPEQLAAGLKCEEGEGITRCTITRALRDAILADALGFAASARIVPSVRDGVPNGMKLYAIRPDGYLGKMGFHNGDTVKRLNGFDLTSPDRALEAYSKIKAAGKVTIDLERRGQPHTIELTLQ